MNCFSSKLNTDMALWRPICQLTHNVYEEEEGDERGSRKTSLWPARTHTGDTESHRQDTQETQKATDRTPMTKHACSHKASGHFNFPGKRKSRPRIPQQAGSRRTCFCVPPPLTFVLEDVLSVGQHTGEGATQKQPQACGPHEQEDDIVGENQQQQECHHHSHLSQRRQRQFREGTRLGTLEKGRRSHRWPQENGVAHAPPCGLTGTCNIASAGSRKDCNLGHHAFPPHLQRTVNTGTKHCWSPGYESMNLGHQYSPLFYEASFLVP